MQVKTDLSPKFHPTDRPVTEPEYPWRPSDVSHAEDIYERLKQEGLEQWKIDRLRAVNGDDDSYNPGSPD